MRILINYTTAIKLGISNVYLIIAVGGSTSEISSRMLAANNRSPFAKISIYFQEVRLQAYD